MKVPDLFVGKQLFVGCSVIPPIALGPAPAAIRGSAYLEGPVMVGTPLSYPAISEANLMVSRCTNPEALALGLVPSIFKVSTRGLSPTPIDVMLGDPTGPVGIQAWCGPMPFFAQAATIDFISGFYSLFSSSISRVGPSIDVGAKLFTGAQAEFSVTSNFDACFTAAPVLGDAPYFAPDMINYSAVSLNSLKIEKKPFDIQHPTKKGWRLRYVSIEGPTADVYVKGKLENSNVIELPDYWTGLVDPETITVNLTPIGSYQELFVEKIEWGKRVIVKNNSSGMIKCSYLICGERIDCEKNIPEYEGEYGDYPGDNSQYFVSGFNLK
jgi:hypothetical protein